MRYVRITSLTNKHIKEAIRLRAGLSQFRHSSFLIEGTHLVEMALDAGMQVTEFFVTDRFIARREHEGLRGKIAKRTGTTYEISEPALRKITDTETPQGIAAIASSDVGDLASLQCRNEPFLVVLDGIQDPGNLGAIIRTADAAGADAALLLPGTCDAFAPKVIRATAGSIFNLPLVYAGRDEVVKWLRKQQIRLAIAEAHGGESLYEVDLWGPIALAFGNEIRGIHRDLKKAAGISLTIPIFGRAESLNVAASAALCLYEVAKQRMQQRL